jgi:hypothetical protein
VRRVAGTCGYFSHTFVYFAAYLANIDPFDGLRPVRVEEFDRWCPANVHFIRFSPLLGCSGLFA